MQPRDLLADHFLSTATIGAIFADPNGALGIIDTVSINCPAGRVMFCCVGGKQQEIADQAQTYILSGADQAEAVVAIREAAAERMIGLTAHETVISRARAAVAKVEQTMADMQKSGALKAMNREFKAAREAGLASSYSAFIHAKKLALLEAMAGVR